MKKLINLSLTLLLFVFSTAGFGQAEDTNPGGDSLAALQQDIQAILKEYKVPGAGIALVKNNQPLWIGAFGYADLASQTPASVDTVFRLGSQSKSFLGLGFLRLAEQGRVELITPILDIVPDLQFENPWRATDPVRVVHLLEHTAGFDDLHMNEFFNATDDPELPLEQVAAISPQTRTVRWKPGSGKSYSNHGYLIAGYVMEIITGQRYEDYLKQELLLPIGMIHSSARLSEVQENLTTAYNNDLSVVPDFNALIRPAGSMNASPKDMALFLEFLLGRGSINGRQVLTADSLHRFENPESFFALRQGLDVGYSLGVRPKFEKGYKGFGHRGGAPGMLGEYLYFPELGMGVSVSFNQMNDKALNKVLDKVLSFMFADIPGKTPPLVSLDSQQLSQFAGYYELRSQRMELMRFINELVGGETVFVKDGSLYISEFSGEPVKLFPVSDHSFRKEGQSEATVIFLRTDEGEVMADSSTHYVKASALPSRITIGLLITTFVCIFSILVYALIWIPVHLYRKYRKNGVGNSANLLPRVLPLLATLALFTGFGALSLHNGIITLGQKNGMNITYLVASYVFAAMSLVSVFFSIPYLKSGDKAFARWHTLVASSSCLALTIYMMYWGFIGLKLWDY